jgi:hypothetical protein
LNSTGITSFSGSKGGTKDWAGFGGNLYGRIEWNVSLSSSASGSVAGSFSGTFGCWVTGPGSLNPLPNDLGGVSDNQKKEVSGGIGSDGKITVDFGFSGRSSWDFTLW